MSWTEFFVFQSDAQRKLRNDYVQRRSEALIQRDHSDSRSRRNTASVLLWISHNSYFLILLFLRSYSRPKFSLAGVHVGSCHVQWWNKQSDTGAVFSQESSGVFFHFGDSGALSVESVWAFSDTECTLHRFFSPSSSFFGLTNTGFEL